MGLGYGLTGVLGMDMGMAYAVWLWVWGAVHKLDYAFGTNTPTPNSTFNPTPDEPQHSLEPQL